MLIEDALGDDLSSILKVKDQNDEALYEKQ